MQELEEFIAGSGDAGFVYFSMGSSVKAANMPEYLRRLLMRVFRQLPQRVLWKWEAEDDMQDLPANVKLARWLPQQDLLGKTRSNLRRLSHSPLLLSGHPKIRAFVTHGGLLSMFETVYHGVPIVTLPVFCDHDSNAAKAEADGYAVKLDLSTLTAETLLRAVRKVIHDPKYREEVRRRQFLLRDQKETPLEKAVYWTEYVLRHKGARHLQSPARDMGVVQYYLLDVMVILAMLCVVAWHAVKLAFRVMLGYLTGSSGVSAVKKSIKAD